MKRNVLALLFIIIFALPLTAGGLFDKTSTPAGISKDPGTASGQGRTINVSYTIDINNQGTRSEGRTHVLIINNFTLPQAFDIVYAANTYYQYKTRKEIWGDQGYARDQNRPIPFSETGKSLTDKDWELGWYEGDKRKEETPRSWVYVERGSLKAFVSPDELDRFIIYFL